MIILFGIYNTAHLHRQGIIYRVYSCLIQKEIQSRTSRYSQFASDIKKGIEHYSETLDIHSTPMKVNHLSYTFTNSKYLVLNLLQNQPN